MFRFAYPEYLWLLWLLPLLVAVWTAAGQLARRRLSRFGRLETLRPLMPDASTGRRRLKFILYLTAFALLTLALARPQLGSKLREVESRGIEMMLVVDVSNSMLAEDFQPNRLERTKYAIDKLFDGLKQDRSATADHLGLPHGQSLCPQNIPFDGFGAGHRHRSGPLAGHHVLFGKGR